MSEQNENEKTIVEKKDENGNVLGLYLRGGRVVFRRHFSSPEPSDGSVWVDAEFSADDYKKGIKELKEKGKCTIKGKPDLTIAIVNDPTTRKVFGPMVFSLEIGLHQSGTFFTNWSANDIVLTDGQTEKELKTTCSKCHQQALVENIFTRIEPAEAGADKLGIVAVRVTMGTERCPHCGFKTDTPLVVRREPLSVADINGDAK